MISALGNVKIFLKERHEKKIHFIYLFIYYKFHQEAWIIVQKIVIQLTKITDNT